MTDDELPPLAVGPDGPDGPLGAPAAEVRRRRTTRRVLVVGGALAAVAAGGVGIVTASGRSSLAALFTGFALVSAVAALVTLLAAARDEFRGTRVPGRRVLAGFGLLLLTPVLLILAAGASRTG